MAEAIFDNNGIITEEGVDAEVARREAYVAQVLGTDLVKQYPGRQWYLEVDIRGGMIIVQCPSLSKNKGWHIAMNDDTLEVLMRKTRYAAGEIMERYGLSRGKVFNPDHVEELPRIFTGEVVASDAEGEDPLKR